MRFVFLLLFLIMANNSFGQQFFSDLKNPHRVMGSQFLTGSTSVNAISYIDFLLDEENEGLYFDAIWVPATLVIRPVDKYGIPAIGPSSSGLQDGVINNYRIGFSAHLGSFSFFSSLDAYAATHIKTDHYFVPFAGVGTFTTGGRKTGFVSRAAQFVPGLEYRFQNQDMSIRLGYIIKLRDPIDESGMFLSRYEPANFVGDYMHGEYGFWDPNPPEGRDGFRTAEPYIGATIYGYDVNSLFANKGIALFQLGRQFLPSEGFINYIEPSVSYLTAGYHMFSNEDIWRFSPELSLSLNSLEIMPKIDVGISPIAFYQYRFALINTTEYNRFSSQLHLGFSNISVTDLDNDTESVYGIRFGLTFTRQLSTVGFKMSYNYSDHIVSDPLRYNSTVFEFTFRSNFFTTMIREN